MRVSVVIPVYDGGRFLDACLASALDQEPPPLEVIVVDDGSRDDTAAVAQRRPDVVYRHQANAGVSVARNHGLKLARGELLALLDADDLWLPGKLRAQVAFLDAHPEVDHVACLYRNFLDDGVTQPSWVNERQLSEPQRGSLSGFVVRAASFWRVGGFDPADPTDLDWALRAQEVGLRGAIVDEVLVARRVHADNMSYELSSRLPELHLRAARAAIARKRRPT